MICDWLALWATSLTEFFLKSPYELRAAKLGFVFVGKMAVEFEFSLLKEDFPQN